MSYARIEGRVITCKLGMSSTSCLDVGSVFKEVRWKEVHPTSPQTAANTVMPKGWYQGHKHIEGEIRVTSEIDAALYVNASGQKFINPGQDHDLMRYMVINVQTTTSGSKLIVFADSVMTQSGTASTVIWEGQGGEVRDFETSYFTYPFKASFVMVSGVHAKT